MMITIVGVLAALMLVIIAAPLDHQTGPRRQPRGTRFGTARGLVKPKASAEARRLTLAPPPGDQ